MWVLIGNGPNEVEIPCLFWLSKEAAVAACREIFKGCDPEIHDGKYVFDIPGCDALPKEVLDKMYTHYYGGCGECWSATLKQVEEGKPFVAFDLD